jgi:hypothetical protein
METEKLVLCIYNDASNCDCEMQSYCEECPFFKKECDGIDPPDNLSDIAEVWLFEHGFDARLNKYHNPIGDLSSSDKRFLYLSILQSIKYWSKLDNIPVDINWVLKQGIECGLTGNYK